MRTQKISAILSTATLLLLACSSADPNSPAPTEVGNTAAEDRAPDPEDSDLAPTGRGHHAREQSVQRFARPSRKRGNGISYHGGPVMTAGPNVHFIWYGNW